jgi:RNA-directed DNA polymerase
LKINLKRNTHFIRYADDFIVVTSSEEAINNVKTAINEFLFSRGLALSEEKTKIIK